MAREINLVPDIKNEMIKAIKLRNMIFFSCIAVSAVAVGVVAILGGIIGGQSLALKNQDDKLKLMSEKINSYDDLNEFLTIQNQLDGISSTGESKRVFSRVFNVLNALLPKGADTITISELSVDMEESVLNFEAQANAGEAPYIDYRVLESFKKSMSYMRYDYGRYVDKTGEEIPAYCMIENGMDGAVLSDAERGDYAFWQINVEGCKNEDDENEYEMEIYNDEDVVRIWRTPQYDEWYEDRRMDLGGEISNVPHFESQCITYSGEEQGDGTVKWASENEECLLAPDELVVRESSNGKGADGDLVLRFSASLHINPEVFRFENKHVLAIGPSGRRNVTDSYIQIQNMFVAPAKDCADEGVDCGNAEAGR